MNKEKEIKKLIDKVLTLDEKIIQISGAIHDSDTILADLIEDVDCHFSGFAQDVFEIWEKSTDKKSVEAMFYEFTDVEFKTYLENCIETMEEQIQEYGLINNKNTEKFNAKIDFQYEETLEARRREE